MAAKKKPRPLPAMWAKAREEVVAAIASDRVRAELRPLSPEVAVFAIPELQRTIQEQIRAATEFIDQDVKVAMEVYGKVPFTMPHHALISAAAHRAFQQGQVSDANLAYHMMQQVLERYLRARS